jgi:uncharacterized protein (DUF433 family)
MPPAAIDYSALIVKPAWQSEVSSPNASIDWRQFIVSTPNVLRGKPRIDGTPIPVALVLGYLASGVGPDEIRAEFPDVRPEHISACLDYARELAEFEVAAT